MVRICKVARQMSLILHDKGSVVMVFSLQSLANDYEKVNKKRFVKAEQKSISGMLKKTQFFQLSYNGYYKKLRIINIWQKLGNEKPNFCRHFHILCQQGLVDGIRVHENGNITGNTSHWSKIPKTNQNHHFSSKR